MCRVQPYKRILRTHLFHQVSHHFIFLWYVNVWIEESQPYQCRTQIPEMALECCNSRLTNLRVSVLRKLQKKTKVVGWSRDSGGCLEPCLDVDFRNEEKKLEDTLFLNWLKFELGSEHPKFE